MSLEVYYAPSSGGRPVTLEKLIAALTAEELVPSVEKEGEKLVWIVFPEYKSTLLVSIEAEVCGLVTLHHASTSKGDAIVPAIIEDVMSDLGYEEAET